MASIHADEHRHMIGLASTIIALARHDACERADEIARLRLQFARLVNSHCAEEGRAIQDAVRAGIVPSDLASSMQRELLAWRADLATCNCEWPSSRLIREPSEFAIRFRKLIEALQSYVAREEAQILTPMGRA
ncbi:hypothetical protein FHY02_002867 [Sphingomonas sp. BK069]|nr:hypothetical protein [Sphingomonas sp. BK069]